MIEELVMSRVIYDKPGLDYTNTRPFTVNLGDAEISIVRIPFC